MKKIYTASVLALSLCATGALAGVSFKGFDMASVKAGLVNASLQNTTTEYNGVPSIQQLSSFAASQTRADESSDTVLPKGVVVETLLNKDFTDWTAGTMEQPDDVDVASDEALFDKFFGANSGWQVFEAFQAGGYMYLGMDEVGDHGPGYFMTPSYDLSDPKAAFRFRVTAMNVNANAQTQGLQAFFMDQAPDAEKGEMFLASSVPMKYNEWSECEWVGKLPTGRTYMRAMGLGWSGKVLIKNITLEKLVYPVASVSDVKLSYQPGTITATWKAAEGAVAYQATAYMVTETETIELGSVKVSEPSASFEAFLSENAERYYVSVVALNEEGEESYPSSGYSELTPKKIGNAVALPATNVSVDGFTANWEAIDYAGRTLVYPVQNHKATANQQYILLNEDFSNVPLTNDEYNPAQIIPMMGMGDMNLYMSTAGWSTDVCIFFRLMPEMPSVVLTNMFASSGFPGYLLSPAYDLSVGGGNVFISGIMASVADDAVVTFFLVDADTNEPYASKEVEVNPEGVFMDITIEGGRPNSRIMFMMTDSGDEEMILIPSLAISVDMNAGEEITAPLPTEFVATPATSFTFDYPVDDDNSYSYTVQGFFRDLSGKISAPVEVNANGSGVATAVAGNGRAVLCGGVLNIANPDGENVTVVSADGKILALSSDSKLSLNVGEGAVIVRIGNKAFKFVR